MTDNLPAQMKKAEALAAASLMPESFRKNPPNVLMAMEVADALGIRLMQAIQGVTVIKGKLTMSAELMRALVLSAGHRFRVDEQTDQACTVTVARREWPDDMQTFTFTMQDAARAGLSNSDTYKKHPKAMLLARVTSTACRAVFPDVIAGVSYTPEDFADQHHAAPAPPPVPAPPAPVVTVERDEPDTAEPLVDTDTGEILDDPLPWEEEPVEAEIVEEAPPPPADGPPATQAQMAKMGALCGALGLDRDQRITYASDVVGRPLESAKDLTKAEASRVIEQLQAEVELITPADV